MADATNRPTKSYALFVYNSETEEEKDAKQIVLNTKTGEFNEVASTNSTMIRLRIVRKEAMDKLAIAMAGVYKDPYKIVIKEINIKAEDLGPESGQIVYLPGDRAGASLIMKTLTHAVGVYKKQTEEQIHTLKTSYIAANRNTLNINHALTEAMRVTRNG